MKKQQKSIQLVMMITMIISTLFYPCGENVSGATPAEIQQWLNAHNNYRALHGVPPVTWSTVIEASAQAWADTCPSGHSVSAYGENMAYASYAQTSQGCVDIWYGEEPLYDYKNPGWNPATGHFTQVVWKNTTQIGCGCKTGCSPWYSVCVCQYNPPGNVIGQFAANVLPPVSKNDILGTWPSGVYYRDSETGSWVKMSTPAKLVAAGDIDGDNTDDLIGVWNSGLYVKHSSSGSWAKFTPSLPSDIDAGLLRGGVWYAKEGDFAAVAKGYAEGPESDRVSGSIR
jgi:pathogenesis-related protein 1